MDERIKKWTVLGYDFLQKVDKHTHCGKYEFEDGCYVNVEDYLTHSRATSEYESHRKYIDFQYIIEGMEIIEISAVDSKFISKEYCEKDDICYFENTESGKQIILSSGEGLVVFPGQTHMPGLMVTTPAYVKKAVLKIPVNRLPKVFVSDVDGTMTDGKIHIGDVGEVYKSFDVKDGYALSVILPTNGFQVGIITGRQSDIVLRRAEELSIEYVIQGCSNKKETLLQLVSKFGRYINDIGILEGVAYMGDDIPDLDCLKISQFAGCPRDAIPEVQRVCDFVSNYKAGEGALREFCDYLVGECV